MSIKIGASFQKFHSTRKLKRTRKSCDERREATILLSIYELAAVRRLTTCNCVLLIATTVITGCLREIHYTSAPGASGRIFDSVDHRPVSDATVSLIPEEIGPYSDKNVPLKVRTSPGGDFRIPRQRDWLVYDARSPAAHVGLCAPALLRVEHQGYESFETNIAAWPADPPEFKVGDIYLKRIPK